MCNNVSECCRYKLSCRSTDEVSLCQRQWSTRRFSVAIAVKKFTQQILNLLFVWHNFIPNQLTEKDQAVNTACESEEECKIHWRLIYGVCVCASCFPFVMHNKGNMTVWLQPCIHKLAGELTTSLSCSTYCTVPKSNENQVSIQQKCIQLTWQHNVVQICGGWLQCVKKIPTECIVFVMVLGVFLCFWFCLYLDFLISMFCHLQLLSKCSFVCLVLCQILV